MMVSAYASRLRLTLATVTADRGTELDAAIEALGLIALKGKVVTGDALHCNRRTVAAINVDFHAEVSRVFHREVSHL
ncbi:hypothetical protein SAMN04488003_1692 [Loktanella fryxellensis]|uniref:Transposase DDE domain-containing protein n=1 Tax=Loktanella fryxellensis TaxID=245187 RepID=A0A1H8KEI5_9RHOB|nr:hypothetical protein [Loktanella fryxellensis]SEN91370.1 hypothetical protein SAMN04488003_1692 [Loktanella fryxellensis]